jgi:hypothetical protein
MCILPTVISVFGLRFAPARLWNLENFTLRHQLNVLKCSLKHRPRLTSAERLLGVVLSRLWADWRSAMTIVQPETALPGFARAAEGSRAGVGPSGGGIPSPRTAPSVRAARCLTHIIKPTALCSPDQCAGVRDDRCSSRAPQPISGVFERPLPPAISSHASPRNGILGSRYLQVRFGHPSRTPALGGREAFHVLVCRHP